MASPCLYWSQGSDRHTHEGRVPKVVPEVTNKMYDTEESQKQQGLCFSWWGWGKDGTTSLNKRQGSAEDVEKRKKFEHLATCPKHKNTCGKWKKAVEVFCGGDCRKRAQDKTDPHHLQSFHDGQDAEGGFKWPQIYLDGDLDFAGDRDEDDWACRVNSDYPEVYVLNQVTDIQPPLRPTGVTFRHGAESWMSHYDRVIS